ncbi:Serine/threonine-protein phosphatase bsl1 [Mortierella alpina]|nr:Serine/threonine-protein phosphatase bsl1 [Mortierella alpina]
MAQMGAIQPRWSHASALINSTLYLAGGTTQDDDGLTSFLDETLALDLSIPWSVDNPAFTTLPRLPVPLSGHSMSKVPGTTKLLVAGGESSDNRTISPILILETTGTGNLWTIPPRLPAALNTTTAAPTTAPFRRLYHAAITTGKDGALLHGGYQSTVVNGTVVSSLVTLKATTEFAPRSTAPVSLATNAPALARHTMTLTQNGQAIILGGINSQGVLANMSIAYVLDTQASNAQWQMVPLKGKPPDPRMAFSAVMVNATSMLVYGGTPDFKAAYWVVFYLDLPTWTWSTPEMQGTSPRRWGHTATMAGNTMMIAFGLSSKQTPDDVPVALLDTTTNTWITEFVPQSMSLPDASDSEETSANGPLSTGAALGIAFLVTAILVGGAFCLLVRRKKRRTRNTLARENLAQHAPRAAIGRQAAASQARGVLHRAAALLGLHAGSKRGKDGPSSREKGIRPDSWRYSDSSSHTHPRSAITARLHQMGLSLAALGYPEDVVQQGTGQVPISSYAYPNQACAETEKARSGHETLIVFHDLAPAQKEHVKQERLLRQQQQQQQHQQRQQQEQPVQLRHELPPLPFM